MNDYTYCILGARLMTSKKIKVSKIILLFVVER